MIENIFCTYFNTGYLSRGLALYQSMEESIDSFKLYIIACDYECYNILISLNLPNAIVLDLKLCLDVDAKSQLANRKGNSFYWSLAPLSIEYVLTKCNEQWCTYVDADCYFYKNPHFVFERMIELNKTVGIVEHNFRNDSEKEQLIKENGRFCVEFNTFRNTADALEVLEVWKCQCLEASPERYENGVFGDQLYLNEWPDKYNCIYISENKGIGVAPWNINNGYIMEDIVMYHFHAIKFWGAHLVSLNIWNVGTRSSLGFIYNMYKDYIIRIRKNSLINNCEMQSVKEIGKANVDIKIIIEKIKGRKEKSIIQLINNIMWV